MIVSSITYTDKKNTGGWYQGNTNKNYNEISHSRQNSYQEKNADENGRKRKCSSLWWECMEDSLDDPHNIEIDVAYARDIQLLDTHSQELKPT